MLDSEFRNNIIFFAQSLKVGYNNPTRNYFVKYYMPLVEIKDFNVLIENKPFFDRPVKKKQEACKTTSRNIKKQ